MVGSAPTDEASFTSYSPRLRAIDSGHAATAAALATATALGRQLLAALQDYKPCFHPCFNHFVSQGCYKP